MLLSRPSVSWTTVWEKLSHSEWYFLKEAVLEGQPIPYPKLGINIQLNLHQRSNSTITDTQIAHIIKQEDTIAILSVKIYQKTYKTIFYFRQYELQCIDFDIYTSTIREEIFISMICGIIWLGTVWDYKRTLNK